jgi:hypothetical protein
MLDDCTTTQIPLSLVGSESTHTRRLLTGISLFDFNNAGDHTPISPFTIMGRDFHLKCHESAYHPHQHSRNCAILRPTFATPLPASIGALWVWFGTSGRRASDFTSKHPCTITKRIDATLLRWRGCVVREHVGSLHCGEPEALPNDWGVERIAPA